MKIQKKRALKKKKNTWRKCIDESDVDAYFEEERFHQRCGYVFFYLCNSYHFSAYMYSSVVCIFSQAIEQKSNAELFSIDTKAKTLTHDSVRFPEPKSIDNSSLKCFKGLENSSAVQDPLIKRYSHISQLDASTNSDLITALYFRNSVRSKEQRQHPALKLKNELKLRKGILKKKELNHLQKLFKKRISCFEQKSRRRISIDKDLWQDEESKIVICNHSQIIERKTGEIFGLPEEVI